MRPRFRSFLNNRLSLRLSKAFDISSSTTSNDAAFSSIAFKILNSTDHYHGNGLFVYFILVRSREVQQPRETQRAKKGKKMAI